MNGYGRRGAIALAIKLAFVEYGQLNTGGGFSVGAVVNMLDLRKGGRKKGEVVCPRLPATVEEFVVRILVG
jgi:hypothetical protein